MNEEIIIKFENVIRHEYFLVLYGILVYFTILYIIYKDEKKKRFSWKGFKDEYKDEFLLALILAPLIVVFDDEMLGWYNGLFEKDIEFGKWFYLCAGAIGNFLYTIVKNMKNIRKIFNDGTQNTTT